MVFLQAKEVEGDCQLVEPVYKTKYGVSELGDVKPRPFPVFFPESNPYMPTDFSKRELGNETIPKLLSKSFNL